MLTPELDAFITRMPKVELHIHLEGAVSPQTLLNLALRNKVEIPARDIAGVEQLFRYRDFSEFLAVFMNLARAFKYGEDFEQLAYEMALASAKENVVYTEVMISPMQHIPRQVDLLEALQGMAAGFERAQRETGIVARSALDYGRQYGVERAWQVLEMAKPAMAHKLVAWSIGGNELDYPPEPFADVFADARNAGLRLMAHAGEVVGPPSVWGAVDCLNCERIGHGVRSIDDPDLVTHLRQQRVTLDVCPTSNLRTGAITSLDAHPLRKLFDAGVRLTINTDDPTFFHTTISDEYRLAAKAFGFTADDLCTVVLNAVRASFLPQAEQDTLYERVKTELSTLRRELGV